MSQGMGPMTKGPTHPNPTGVPTSATQPGTAGAQGKAEAPFVLVASRDGLEATIPKGTVVSRSVERWSEQDCKHILASMGFHPEFESADLINLKRLARNWAAGLPRDFVFLRGVRPQEPQPARLEWLNPKTKPFDQVTKGQVFLKIIAAVKPRDGRDVQGRALAPQNPAAADELALELAPEFVMLPDRTVKALASGQAYLDRNKLAYSSIYLVENPSQPEFRQAEFFSDVRVPGDLPLSCHWKVHGSLVVEGHWEAHAITVHGNAVARGGIQTNMAGVLRIHGSCKASYLQMSRLGCTGRLTVDSAILQSDVRVGGEIICRGTPGAIMGSDVDCFGPVIANKAGSDRGRPTRITIHELPEGAVASIGMVHEGTQMSISGRAWVAQSDRPYNSAQEA